MDIMIKRLFETWFGANNQASSVRPLYDAIIAQAREPSWYVDGGVADTMDGRFDMISAVFAVVMIRLESLGDDAKPVVTFLTETFVTDMDSQLRELGFGDVGLGKHVGNMMSALGGRIGVYRDALTSGDGLEAGLVRNLYRDVAPSSTALAFVADKLRSFHKDVGGLTLADLLAAKL